MSTTKKLNRTTRKRRSSLAPCSAPCPKCGSQDIHRRHAPAGAKLDLGYERRDMERVNEYVRINGWLDAEVKLECIMHHCRCCQFEWETAKSAFGRTSEYGDFQSFTHKSESPPTDP